MRVLLARMTAAHSTVTAAAAAAWHAPSFGTLLACFGTKPAPTDDNMTMGDDQVLSNVMRWDRSKSFLYWFCMWMQNQHEVSFVGFAS